MKTKIVLLIVLTLASVALAAGQTMPSAIAGRWQGDKQGTPCVTLELTLDNGELSGTAMFFILDRTEHELPPRVLGKQEVQLLNPKLTGNVLSFKVKKQQGGVIMKQSSAEALVFHMTLEGNKTGVLKSNDPENPSVRMIKQ
jgi:hypothetical protein